MIVSVPVRAIIGFKPLLKKCTSFSQMLTRWVCPQQLFSSQLSQGLLLESRRTCLNKPLKSFLSPLGVPLLVYITAAARDQDCLFCSHCSLFSQMGSQLLPCGQTEKELNIVSHSVYPLF